MSQKKYASLNTLQTFLDNLRNLFATKTEMNAKANATHEHSVSDVTDLKAATWDNDGLLSTADKMQLDYGGIKKIPMSSSDGATWTATIDGLGELVSGMTYLFVPDRTSSSTSLTLNVNGLGAVAVRRKLSSGTATLSNPTITTQFFANRPVLLMYDTAMPNGTAYWIALEFTKPSANDLYGYVPVQNGGWYVNTNTTDDDLVEARESLNVYSKADQSWVQIYDSGEITEKVNAFANINISGYKKLMVAVKCVNDGTNSSSKHGGVTFTATDGTKYQFNIWSTMFTNAAYTSGAMATFEVDNGWLICSNATRILKSSNFLGTEGGVADNLNNTGSGIMRCTNTLSTMMISTTDNDANYYFLAGSRVIVWGCVG